MTFRSPEFFEKHLASFENKELTSFDFVLMTKQVIRCYRKLFEATQDVKPKPDDKDRRCVNCGSLAHWQEDCDWWRDALIKANKRIKLLEEDNEALRERNQWLTRTGSGAQK